MGERQINIDCDVLQADGGTRTAAITGSWVALHFAFERLIKEGKLAANPITGQVAAVSCGLWEGTPVLDLDYPEDSTAQADANFVLTGDGGIVEVQGTAEEKPFSEPQFLEPARACQEGRRRAGAPAAAGDRQVPDGAPLRLAQAGRGHPQPRQGGRDPHACCRRFGVEIVSAGELGLPAPEETGTTFEDNATLKALAATRASGPAGAGRRFWAERATRSDGQPGVHTADWEGPTRDAMVGMRRIQDELAGARRARHRRRARRHLPLRAGAGLARRASSSWCTARSTAASSGRRAAAAATATIPASSRTATRAPRRR